MIQRTIRTILLLLTILSAVPAAAQELSVKSMTLDVNDITGNLDENLVRDNNDQYGGLVRVYLAAPGATFEGWVLRQQKHNASEYRVVMAKNSYQLTVVAPGFLPLEVNFRDYGINGIEPRRTYALTISIPQTFGSVPQDDGMRFLTMKVEPQNGVVYVDNELQSLDENGELSIYLPMGIHKYSVSAKGYAPKEGSINLTDNTPTEVVRLVSTRATLRVECPTEGAKVVVSGQQRGTVPWSGSLDAGNYKVEVRLDGYHSQQQSVTLGEKENRTLTFPALQQIVGSIKVNYRPIGSEVFVDGNKIGTSPNVFRNIPVGSRRIEIRKDGYQPFSQTVTIRENEQSDLTGSLTANTTASPGTSVCTGTSGSKETFTVNGVSFTMIRVDGGTFTMGSNDSEADDDESPVHSVTLSTYMIGETEVTQALWQAVMGSNPSYFKSDQNRPVESVSWNDCQEFIKKLNSLTGKKFRLPTEAEWEYAARGGNKCRKYKYSGSNNIDDVAWYWENSGDKRLSGEWNWDKISNNNCKPHPVGKKSPNELGIYDMSGNVWEWCSDWKGAYSSSSQTNPQGPSSGSYRVYRGGSWFNYARNCRSANRGDDAPINRDDYLGLRLAL